MTEGSAAVSAGLAIGDEIVAVDGVPAPKLKLYELRERFKQPAGTKLALTVKGKDGERKLDLVLADQV